MKFIWWTPGPGVTTGIEIIHDIIKDLHSNLVTWFAGNEVTLEEEGLPPWRATRPAGSPLQSRCRDEGR